MSRYLLYYLRHSVKLWIQSDGDVYPHREPDRTYFSINFLIPRKWVKRDRVDPW